MSLISFLPSPPFLFTLLVVSGLASKTLHIIQHLQSLPFLYFVLYSPTLFLPDLLVIIVGRLLLPLPESRSQWIACICGSLLALVTWGASAIQFGFFFQTGSEVEWTATDSFLRDPAAMKILMSGISSVSVAAAVIALASWFLSPRLHTFTGTWMQSIARRCRETFEQPRSLLPFAKVTTTTDRRSFRWLIPILAITVSLGFLEATRPAVPWDHLSGALPLTLLNAFRRPSHEKCRPPRVPFPLADEDNDMQHHHSPHWIPDPRPFDEDPLERPSWLPAPAPAGFHRWDKHDAMFGFQPQCPGNNQPYRPYNPLTDPLKVSNLDGDILGPLQQAFEHSDVKINHVVLLTLESARKEVFPMQSGTPLYDALIESHKEEAQDEAIDRLSQLTPVAQMVTGEYALNSQGERNAFNGTKWQDHSAAGMGGINVKGALTGSTLTFKSILGSHCGVSPLPVDLLEEVNQEIYQPCLPQIFELFNQLKQNPDKKNRNDTEGFLSQMWESVFVQSITETYDRQDQMNKKMGFKTRISKETLNRHKSKYYPPKTEEINYFGFAENETYPYLRDIIHGAVHNHTRLFLSHVTSTTHHPWHTPEDFPHQKYTGREGTVDHGPMNNYLNTVAYTDQWLGEVLNLLDEAGISNSTLVVIVGDHGQAFSEDNKVTGTFENGHISNFRVPLVFRHPHLPRIEISANATSLSIIPTILDLLVQSSSLDESDSTIASGLIGEYQGQSLIRPWKNEDEDLRRPVWNMGIINAGASMVSVTDATVPYRLVLPLKENFEYRFTHLRDDPAEKTPLHAWSVEELVDDVEREFGGDAAEWVSDAERVGWWWVSEQKRIWDYRGG